MKQHGKHGGSEPWHGHREISQAGMALYMAELRVQGRPERFLGLRERDAADLVDRGQAAQDELIAMTHYLDELTGQREFAWLGRTTQALADRDGDRPVSGAASQILHAMASDHANGNLSWDRVYKYTRTQFMLAVEAASADEPTQAHAEAVEKHFGNAAHALQDSYSGAHTWRHKSVLAGNVEAPVESMNRFADFGRNTADNTHFHDFDSPPSESGTSRAAAEATRRLIRAFDRAVDQPERAAAIFEAELDPILARVENVKVNATSLDPQWQAEKNLRLDMENGRVPAPAGAPVLEDRGISTEPEPFQATTSLQGPGPKVVRVVGENGQETAGRAAELDRLKNFLDQAPLRPSTPEAAAPDAAAAQSGEAPQVQAKPAGPTRSGGIGSR